MGGKMSVYNGVRSGVQGGVRNGLARSLAVVPTSDATSGKYMPASAAEYTALGLVTPDELWIGNPASGNLVGAVAGGTLTAVNAPLYQQSVTGWTSKGVRGNATTGNQAFGGTGPDPNTQDIVILAYIGNMVPDAVARSIIVCGTSENDFGLSMYDNAGIKTLRMRGAGGLADTSFAYGAGGYAVMLGGDVTNSRMLFVTDQEKKAPVYGAATSGTVFGIGAPISGTFAAATVMYLARFTGASARALSTPALAKTFLQALGWTIGWV